MVYKHLFSLLLVLVTIAGLAQPKEIYGIAKEQKSAEYYQEQKALWLAETQIEPTNAHAWHMYYSASRAYLQKSDYQKWVNHRTDVLKALEPIIAEAKKHIDGSYEYYLLESINTDSDQSIEFTKKAYTIDPERSETYESLMLHYVTTFDKQSVSEIATRMLARNYYSNANYLWNLNALNTAEKDGIYLSMGDNDTFPRWILQYGANERADVHVLNLWVLTMNEDYLSKVFQDLELPTFSKTGKDFESDIEYVNALMVHIMKNAKQAVYVNCGTDIKIFKNAGIADRMYVVGSALTYCEKDLDHIGLLRKNFETVYDLEYLNHDFQMHTESEHVRKVMNLSYVPGLINLLYHYKTTGEIDKVERFEAVLYKIADDSDRKDDILSWYK